ncbi:MAG: hypothetical protein AAF517_07050 [Planctomycetota bacterium]
MDPITIAVTVCVLSTLALAGVLVKVDTGSGVARSSLASVAVLSAHYAVVGSWDKPLGAWEMQVVWVVAVALSTTLLAARARPGMQLRLSCALSQVAVLVLVVIPGVRAESLVGGDRFWIYFQWLCSSFAAYCNSTGSRPSYLSLTVATIAGLVSALAFAGGYATYTALAALLGGVVVPVGLVAWKRSQPECGAEFAVFYATLHALAFGAYLHADEGSRPDFPHFSAALSLSTIVMMFVLGLYRYPLLLRTIRAKVACFVFALAFALAALEGLLPDPEDSESGVDADAPYEFDFAPDE